MRFISSKPLTFSFILFSFLLSNLFIIQGCRKVSQEQSLESESAINKKFFSVPANTNDVVKAIAQSIRRQDSERHFVGFLSRRAGFPLWHKALIATKNFTGARVDGGDSSKVIVIPFVKENGNVTNAVLIVNTASISRDTSYKLIYAATYKD